MESVSKKMKLLHPEEHAYAFSFFFFNTKFGEKEFSKKYQEVSRFPFKRACKLNFSRVAFSEIKLSLSLSFVATNLLIKLKELKELKERFNAMDNISKDCCKNLDDP